VTEDERLARVVESRRKCLHFSQQFQFEFVCAVQKANIGAHVRQGRKIPVDQPSALYSGFRVNIKRLAPGCPLLFVCRPARFIALCQVSTDRRRVTDEFGRVDCCSLWFLLLCSLPSFIRFSACSSLRSACFIPTCYYAPPRGSWCHDKCENYRLLLSFPCVSQLGPVCILV